MTLVRYLLLWCWWYPTCVSRPHLFLRRRHRSRDVRYQEHQAQGAVQLPCCVLWCANAARSVHLPCNRKYIAGFLSMYVYVGIEWPRLLCVQQSNRMGGRPLACLRACVSRPSMCVQRVKVSWFGLLSALMTRLRSAGCWCTTCLAVHAPVYCPGSLHAAFGAA